MDHPAVQQVVTFAMPHDKLGEEVAAAVVLREGESRHRARAARLRLGAPRRLQGAAEDPLPPGDPEGRDGQAAAHRARGEARARGWRRRRRPASLAGPSEELDDGPLGTLRSRRTDRLRNRSRADRSTSTRATSSADPRPTARASRWRRDASSALRAVEAHRPREQLPRGGGEAGAPRPRRAALVPEGRRPAYLAPGGPSGCRRRTWARSIYEGELGIVIGSEARDVAEAEADRHVFGYTCVNDVTALDLLGRDPAFPQWSGPRASTPSEPSGRSSRRASTPLALTVRTLLKGKVRQEYPCSDMIFGPRALVSRLSRDMTLLPGDVIACGTSLGIGVLRPRQHGGGRHRGHRLARQPGRRAAERPDEDLRCTAPAPSAASSR